jgi:hypothetical protein
VGNAAHTNSQRGSTTASTRNKLVVTAGVIGACIASLIAAPAFAATASTAQPLGLDISSGDTLGAVIERAVDLQGTGAVSAALDSLSTSAAGGNDINFPGLESLSPAETASDLAAISAAVSARQPIPEAIAGIVVAPTPEATVTTGQTAIAPRAFAAQAAAASDWTTYMANTAVMGTSTSGGRVWTYTADMGHTSCTILGLVGCKVVDHWNVRVSVTPQNYSSLFQIQSSHTVVGNVVGTPKLTLRAFRISSVVEIRNSNQMPAGATTLTVVNSPNLSFLNNQASYYFHVFGSGTSEGTHDVKWRTPVADCNSVACTW